MTTLTMSPTLGEPAQIRAHTSYSRETVTSNPARITSSVPCSQIRPPQVPTLSGRRSHRRRSAETAVAV